MASTAFRGLNPSTLSHASPIAERMALMSRRWLSGPTCRSVGQSRRQHSSFTSGLAPSPSRALSSRHSAFASSRLSPFTLAAFRGLAAPAPRSTPLPTRPSHRHASSSSPTSNAQLAHLEQVANGSPANSAAQNGFYAALLRAGMPDILVERYETGRYATNPACDAMYYRALERVAQDGGQGAGAAGAAAAHHQPGGAGGLSSQALGAVTRAVSATRHGAAMDGARISQSGTGARASPIYVTVDESRRAFLWKVLRFVVVFAVVSYFSMMLVGLMVEVTGIFRKTAGAQKTEVKPEEQKTRFADVKGCPEAIEEMQEVVDFLKHPERFNSLGGKPPKGILMVGPPGTGKTLLARAVAGEAGVPFFYMAGSEFDEMYVGVGAKRVRELFDNAKAKSPAIIFIDELDAVGGKRNERDASYHMQTLNQLLTELDGFEQGSGVIIIGATNFPKMLDKALTRPGRFDRQIVVELPDVRGRMDILKHYMSSMRFAPGIDASVIARGTPGFSGADIENLVNQAAVNAGKTGAASIAMADLEWARDRILMGAAKKSMVVQDKDKLMTAYHEAGHALMGHFNEAATPLYKITILPRGGALGVTHFMNDMDKVSMSKREMLAQIDVSMGGKAAEELIYGDDNVTSGCSSDLLNATSIAYSMVVQYGMSETLGSIAFDSDSYGILSTETKHRVEAEVRRILDESMERTRRMLASKRRELDVLAEALIKHETLTKDEMARVLVGEALPALTEGVPASSAIAGLPIKLPEPLLPPAAGLPSPPVNGADGGGGASGTGTGRPHTNS